MQACSADVAVSPEQIKMSPTAKHAHTQNSTIVDAAPDTGPATVPHKLDCGKPELDLITPPAYQPPLLSCKPPQLLQPFQIRTAQRPNQQLTVLFPSGTVPLPWPH
jgi:hypothetical protein